MIAWDGLRIHAAFWDSGYKGAYKLAKGAILKVPESSWMGKDNYEECKQYLYLPSHSQLSACDGFSLQH
jgi:hypothetical protein